MVSKDVATLSQWLQCIILCMHQLSVCILYKPRRVYTQKTGYPVTITQRPSDSWHQHQYTHISTTKDIPVCTSIEDIRNAIGTDAGLQMLQTDIMTG